jgi:hypothetical protein
MNADSGGASETVDPGSVAEKPAWPTFELLPVFPYAGRIFLLRPRDVGSWVVEARARRDPHDVVVSALRLHGLSSRVIHSTSWRLESDRLVLTYLVALSGPPPSVSGFERVVVRRVELARAGPYHAPRSIDVGQVVEHGLRHLSWLAADDTDIRDALGPAWLQALTVYRPEPCRML